MRGRERRGWLELQTAAHLYWDLRSVVCGIAPLALFNQHLDILEKGVSDECALTEGPLANS